VIHTRLLACTLKADNIFAGYIPIVPAVVGKRMATCILMATATLHHPTAAPASTTPTASATATTRGPTRKARVPTSRAVTLMIFVTIILPHATITGTMNSVITQDVVILDITVNN